MSASGPEHKREKRQKQFYWNYESWIILNFQSIDFNHSLYKIRYTYIIIKYDSMKVETERFFSTTFTQYEQ